MAITVPERPTPALQGVSVCVGGVGGGGEGNGRMLSEEVGQGQKVTNENSYLE